MRKKSGKKKKNRIKGMKPLREGEESACICFSPKSRKHKEPQNMKKLE
jgi:hypothetical protein